MPVSFHASAAAGPSSGAGRPFRVLCYGDSLTAGFCAEGRQYEPYGRALAEALGLAGVTACEVTVCGHSGHTAAEMVANLDAATVEDVGGMIGKGLRRILEEDPMPDLVLLMAGTNDIGCEAHPQAILEDVCRLHSICHACGVRTVALAPPPAPRAPAGSPWEMRRRKVVSLLGAWARASRASGSTAFLEPSELVPNAAGSCLWDADGLHLSPSGSRVLGQRLAKLIAPMLQTASSESPLAKRRLGQQAHAIQRAVSPNIAAAGERKVVPVPPRSRSVHAGIAGSTMVECYV